MVAWEHTYISFSSRFAAAPGYEHNLSPRYLSPQHLPQQTDLYNSPKVDGMSFVSNSDMKTALGLQQPWANLEHNGLAHIRARDHKIRIRPTRCLTRKPRGFSFNFQLSSFNDCYWNTDANLGFFIFPLTEILSPNSLNCKTGVDNFPIVEGFGSWEF
ncbi:hypothetical protein Ahy_A08g039639 isoform A [Arachis hypogaea]|uniref:Uncharacterized protein n=1 Tax=Arachis hypogaea TaxID=3818 RepID=A0A445BWV6_ARAHY|nr:hypothetical protein Ahy_A08g039639 isoform A [Arachis hypogaea]